MASEHNNTPTIAVDPITATPVDLAKAGEIRIEADESVTVTPPPITVTEPDGTNSNNILKAHQVPSPIILHPTTIVSQSQDASILPKERVNKDSDGKAATPTLTPTPVSVPRLDEEDASEQDAFLNRRSVNKRKKPHSKLKESQMIIEVQEENVARKHRYIGRHEPLPEDYIDSRCGKYVKKFRKFSYNYYIYAINNYNE